MFFNGDRSDTYVEVHSNPVNFMFFNGVRSDTTVKEQSSTSKFKSLIGDRSNSLAFGSWGETVPLQFNSRSPTSARTGEISVMLYELKLNFVTTPFSIVCVSLPSKPGLSSCSFFTTAEICSSGFSAATDLSQALNSVLWASASLQKSAAGLKLIFSNVLMERTTSASRSNLKTQ